jgi:chromate reductase, NAD(P)H dehydrogenase (quinone)
MQSREKTEGIFGFWRYRSSTMRILGISGSLRTHSTHHTLLRAIKQMRPHKELSLYSRLELLPPFNPDQDAEGSPMHPEVKRLRAAVRQAEGVVFSTPEYAHGIPGTLKNLLDWLVSSGELNQKPVILWSASPSGAQHVHEQMLQVLRALDAKLAFEGCIRIPNMRNAFDTVGTLVSRPLEMKLDDSLCALEECIAEQRNENARPSGAPSA